MKNLTIFSTHPSWIPDFSLLDKNLSIPGKLGYSWKVLRDGLPYIRIGENIILTCELQKKLIPAQVVADEVKKRVTELEKEQGYKLGKKQTQDVKEAILIKLHEQAFVTSKLINVWINTKHNTLCIESTGKGLVDDVMTRLSRDIEYHGKPIEVKNSVIGFMRHIILSDAALLGSLLRIGRNLVLQDDENKKQISYKNEDIVTDEIKNHLFQGKTPKRIELEIMRKCVSFEIDENLIISKINIDDIKIERSDYDNEDDYFDSLFAMYSAQCMEIITSLLDVLGEVNQFQEAETTEEELQRSYEDGYLAAAQGKQKSDCPIIRAELVVEWVRGWNGWHEDNSVTTEEVA